MDLGHYEQAFKCFKNGHEQETLFRGKENVLNGIYVEMGNALMKLGKYRQAYKYLRLIFQTSKPMINDLDPKKNDILYQLYSSVAICQMHCGMHKVAEKNLWKALTQKDIQIDLLNQTGKLIFT
jgi:tetratricopeptide (TPR) repeat protein